MAIRVGMIGCGGRSRAHTQGLLATKDRASFVAVCDPVKEMAETRAKDVGAAHVYTDYRDLVARDDIDAVMIATPHALHAPQTIAAAESGKHILVEKPMCNTMDEARAMVDAAARAGVTLMIAQNQRYNTGHRGIKRLIDEGAIGKVFCARADANQYLHGVLPTGHWLYSKAQAGGGIVISVAVHKLDLLRYLVGDIRRVASFQRMSGVNPGMDCEDVSVAILEFENGATGEMTSLYSAKRAPWGELLMLYGTAGNLHNVGGWQVYSEQRPEWAGGFTPLKFAETPPDHVTMVAHFLDCIEQKREPLTSGRDNLKTMQVITAIYRAAETGEVVEVGTV